MYVICPAILYLFDYQWDASGGILNLPNTKARTPHLCELLRTAASEIPSGIEVPYVLYAEYWSIFSSLYR